MPDWLLSWIPAPFCDFAEEIGAALDKTFVQNIRNSFAAIGLTLTALILYLPLLRSVSPFISIMAVCFPLLSWLAALYFHGLSSASGLAMIGFGVSLPASIYLSIAWFSRFRIWRVQTEVIGSMFAFSPLFIAGQLVLAAVFPVLVVLHGIGIMRTDTSARFFWVRLAFLAFSLWWSVWTVFYLSLALSAHAVWERLGDSNRTEGSSLLRPVSVAFPIGRLLGVKWGSGDPNGPILLVAAHSVNDYFQRQSRMALLYGEVIGARFNPVAWENDRLRPRELFDRSGLVPMVLLLALAVGVIYRPPGWLTRDLWRMTCFVLLVAMGSVAYGTVAIVDAFRLVYSMYAERPGRFDRREQLLRDEFKTFFRALGPG
jgi:hypothetical protein